MDEYFPLTNPSSYTSAYDPGLILVIFGYLAVLWFLVCRTPERQPLFPPRVGH